VHERVTLNGLSFPRDAPLSDDLAAWRAVGAERVGLHRDKLAATGWDLSLLRGGPAVEYLVHRSMFTLSDMETWPADRERLRVTLDAAAAIGAPRVYGTTGPGIGDGSVAALGEALAPLRSHGVRVAFEVAPARHAALHFLHTLRDTVAAARAVGAGVCLDVRSCAEEPGLDETICGAGHVLELVQVNDLVPGSDEYAVPGRGVAPIERILARVLETGYEGPFDVKLLGRPLDAVLEGAAFVSGLLDRWGVAGRASGAAAP
jgi:sugar phosphate isomerase/epimerase